MLLFLCLSILFSNAQIYNDYLGAGHNQGITISTSDNTSTNSQNNTSNGSGLSFDYKGTSRFLNLASIGADFETIETDSGFYQDNGEGL